MRVPRLVRYLSENWGLGRKMAALLLVLLLVGIVNVGAVSYYQQQTSEAERLSNLASEQSVLSQRMAFLASQYARNETNSTQLNETIAQYERNLAQLERATTRSDGRPLPVGTPEFTTAQDELDTQTRVWENYSGAIRTVAATEPYNPVFERALTVVRTRNDEIDRQTEAIGTAYRRAGDPANYTTELAVVDRLRYHNGQIASLSIRIAQSRSQYGSNVYLENRLRRQISEYDQLLALLETGGTFEGRPVDPAPASVQDDIGEARTGWAAYRDDARTIAQQDRLNSEFWTALEYVRVNSDDLDRASQAVSAEMRTIANSQQARLQQLLVALLVVNVGTVLLGLVWIRRRVSRPLTFVTERADQIANDELDVDLPEPSREDEIGDLMQSFRQMRDNLRSLIGDLRFVEQLAEQSGVGLVAYTEDGRIEYANPAYATLVGRDRDALVGVPIWAVNPEVDPDQFDAYWASFEPDETRRTETVHEHADGRQFPVEVTSTRVRIDERAYHVATVRDITARKERDQRIAVLNRVLRHNLRNELSVILGGIEYGRRHYPDDADETPLVNAQRASERMRRISEKAKIIDETLTQADDTVGAVPLAQLVSEAREQVESRYPAADISTAVPPDSYVLGDEFLTVAVEEILENAVVHNDNPEPTIEVTVEETDESVELTVADDGPGIPETEREVLAEQRSITQLYHGSGLGLWTVNWIVQHCGGDLDIEYREPRGTAVVFRLVAADPAEAAGTGEAAGRSDAD